MRGFSFLLSLLVLLAVLPATPWVQWPRADREAVYRAWMKLPETERPPFPSFRDGWAERQNRKAASPSKVDPSKIDKMPQKNLAPH